MTTAETLSQLWEQLAAPSAGIRAREVDVREFVASKSERKILAKGVKSPGKVVAVYEHDR